MAKQHRKSTRNSCIFCDVMICLLYASTSCVCKVSPISWQRDCVRRNVSLRIFYYSSRNIDKKVPLTVLDYISNARPSTPLICNFGKYSFRWCLVRYRLCALWKLTEHWDRAMNENAGTFNIVCWCPHQWAMPAIIFARPYANRTSHVASVTDAWNWPNIRTYDTFLFHERAMCHLFGNKFFVFIFIRFIIQQSQNNFRSSAVCIEILSSICDRLSVN